MTTQIRSLCDESNNGYEAKETTAYCCVFADLPCFVIAVVSLLLRFDFSLLLKFPLLHLPKVYQLPSCLSFPLPWCLYAPFLALYRVLRPCQNRLPSARVPDPSPCFRCPEVVANPVDCRVVGPVGHSCHSRFLFGSDPLVRDHFRNYPRHPFGLSDYCFVCLPDVGRRSVGCRSAFRIFPNQADPAGIKEIKKLPYKKRKSHQVIFWKMIKRNSDDIDLFILSF